MNPKIVGGKAANLALLKGYGANVPDFFCIGSSEFSIFSRQIREKIMTVLEKIDYFDKESLSSSSNEIKELILKNEVQESFSSQIIKSFNKLVYNSKSKKVAVRSSVVGEDGDEDSFAGMMESFLFVIEDELISSIKKCWASAFSERALYYRHIRGIKNEIKIGIVIQRMVEPDISGVLFSNHEGKVLISYTKGVSHSLLAGLEEGYMCSVVRDLKSIIPTNGLIKKMQALELSRIALKMEEKFNKALDIEWAIKDNKIFLLQARAISTEQDSIWDNSNIIESYSEVTTPLTFSVAREAYFLVYTQFCQILGVPKLEISSNKKVLKNMIGLIEGRVYYNLTNWYKLLSMLPLMNQTSGYMENMMGVRQSFEVNRISRRKKSVRKKTLMACMILKHWIMIDDDVKKFHHRFDILYSEYRELDIKEMSSEELGNLFLKVKKELISEWKAPIVNDFLAMVFYGLLRNMTIKWLNDEDGSIYSELFCGERGIESTMPPRLIAKMAKRASMNPTYFELSDEEFLSKLMSGEDDKLSGVFSEFMDKYGFRCVGELRLEEKSYKDRPTDVVRFIKSYMASKNLDELISGELEILKKRSVESKVGKLLSRHSSLKRVAFWFVVKKARKYMRFRENMRLCRTKAYGLLRDIFNELGNRFEAKKLISSSEDIFYLTLDEVLEAAEGKPGKKLKEQVSERKKQFDAFRKNQPPPNRFILSSGKIIPLEGKQTSDLKGIGCSPGLVSAKALIVEPPLSSVKMNKEILVAKNADPGWVVIFPLCSGILIERGSILSHSAIVARELGIPAIVNIQNLTKKIKSGNKVRMNGSTGQIELLRD